jgi:hypothetical protein
MTKVANDAFFSRPRLLAGGLLLVFLAQCLWLTRFELRVGPPTAGEELRIREGLAQWKGQKIAGAPIGGAEGEAAFDVHHSPVWYLFTATPLAFWPAPLDGSSYRYWGWLERVPYLLAGVLLGASLWYVTHRLFGNAGGYIALMLYCFSPAMIRTCALAGTEPEIVAPWGAFGAVYTAVAVAHTLYAPREVVLWNWRRIVLLGVSLFLAVGTQFSLAVLVPLTLGLLLYLAPERRRAAFSIWIAGCGVALVLLFASYFLHGRIFFESMMHARWIEATEGGLGMAGNYLRVLHTLSGASPAFLLALPFTLAAYGIWRRARYFGNTAPLLVAGVCVVLGLAAPHYPGQGFLLVAAPFLFSFVGGVCADLLETSFGAVVRAGLFGLLGANALWNVVALGRL